MSAKKLQFSRGLEPDDSAKRLRRVLFISQWFDPEPTGKGLTFAKELANRGFQVTVLTGFPNYPGGKIYEGYQLKVSDRQVLEGIILLRVWLYPSHSKSKTGRVFNYVSFAISALIFGGLQKNIDLIYAYHPPGLVPFVAGILGRAKKCPVITDIQDLWPESLVETGMFSNLRLVRAVALVMREVYRRSNEVIVISRGFRRALISQGVPKEKISVIPNWADEERLGEASKPELSPKYSKNDNTFRVIYAGNIGPAQGLETIVEAWGSIGPDYEGMHLTFLGNGILREKLMATCDSRGFQEIDFLPGVPIGEVRKFMSFSDVALVSLSDRKLFEITIPSKLQVAMYFGKPIIAGVAGEAADIVREAQCGFVFEPGNQESFLRALRSMREISHEDREEFGVSGKSYYEKHFSKSKGIATTISVLNRLFE